MGKVNGDYPKSFSRYTWKDIKKLGVRVEESALFGGVAEVQPSEWLLSALDNPPVIKSGTEKAKGEFLIAPVIREIVKRNQDKVAVFSGYPFIVDETRGLCGSCDYVFSTDMKSVEINAPVFFLAEAKNESLDLGGPQCVAEMYAASQFNQSARKVTEIYGAVTFGREWLFYHWVGDHLVHRDTKVYPLTELPKILGILQFIIEQRD